jgi:hypothetical protein
MMKKSIFKIWKIKNETAEELKPIKNHINKSAPQKTQ